jgi:hypothetical protein
MKIIGTRQTEMSDRRKQSNQGWARARVVCSTRLGGRVGPLEDKGTRLAIPSFPCSAVLPVAVATGQAYQRNPFLSMYTLNLALALPGVLPRRSSGEATPRERVNRHIDSSFQSLSATIVRKPIVQSATSVV